MILRRMAYSLAFMIATPLLVGLFFLGSWAADRDIPVTISNSEVLTPFVAPCGVFENRLTVNRKQRTGVHVDRFVFDAKGRRWTLEDQDIRVLPAGEETYVSTALIPCAAAIGPAHTLSSASYFRNPLHQWFPIEDSPRMTPFCITPDGTPSEQVCRR